MRQILKQKATPSVALFTPLPPAKTGTADYGASLAEALREIVPLKVYQSPLHGFMTDGFDSVVYQIGNNAHHAAIYQKALASPGVAVLHEANVHHLVMAMTLAHGNHNAYLREVLYEMTGKDVSILTGKRLPLDVPQQHEFTMLRRLLERTRALIVHSRFTERQVRLRGFEGPVLVVPHGAEARTIDMSHYRRRLGIEDKVPLIGVFGYQRPDKQAWECLLIFKQLLADLSQVHLLVVGEPHPQVPIEQGVRDLGLQERVTVLGHQTLSDFDGYLGSCDIVLNLRQSTFGETSGTTMRAFGLGRPVVVSDIGAAQELPDDVCLKIPRDQYEKRVIIECLKWLAANTDVAREIGERARRWVAAECTWATVARQYVDFLHGPVADLNRRKKSTKQRIPAKATSNTAPLTASTVSSYFARWIDPASPAGSYYREHDHRLIRTLQLTPRGDRNSRILEMGCYMQMTPALSDILGYGEVRGAYFGNTGGAQRSSVTARDGQVFHCTIDLYNAERDRFPYSDEYFDTVLCCELLEHLQADPMHMMTEFHRILRLNGTLVLTTPNAVSIRAARALWLGVHPQLFSKYVIPTLVPEAKHFREYTPKELLLLFRDSGFTVRHIETAPYRNRLGKHKVVTKAMAAIKSIVPFREECVYLIGQKTNSISTRYPSWLYEPV